MPRGLQIFDSNGNETLNITMSLGRILGSFRVTGGSGSVVNDGFLQGTPFYLIVPEVQFGVYPTASINGNTLNWAYGGLRPNVYQDFLSAATIFYGYR